MVKIRYYFKMVQVEQTLYFNLLFLSKEPLDLLFIWNNSTICPNNCHRFAIRSLVLMFSNIVKLRRWKILSNADKLSLDR
jgi:hypothetical protein